MPNHAALIIDLDSFVTAREQDAADAAPPVDWDPVADFSALVGGAGRLVDGRRVVVRRAYANFNVWRRENGDGFKDYYLQSLPKLLLERGIEPVQVYRYPGGSSRSAVDARLTADCLELMHGNADVDAFVLVSGDAGLLPLAAELRRRGAIVAMVGSGAGGERIARSWVDRWEIVDRLGHGAPGDGVRGRGSRGSSEGGEDVELGTPRHDAGFYRDVLRYGQPRFWILAPEDWEEISARVWDLATAGGTARPRVRHQELLDELTGVFESSGMDSAHGKVSSALFQIFKAGCFLRADVEGRVTDFHWSNEAVLDPGIETVDQLRSRVREYLVEILCERLERLRLEGGPDPDQLAALFEGRVGERRAVS